MKDLRQHATRRQFLADVGKGVLIAGVGTSLATDLGLPWVLAEEGPTTLSFGAMESLAGVMQDTHIEKLQTLLVEKLRTGTHDLRQLTAAASLANARQFGGDDYTGYHALMALAPAYEISRELPAARQPLPVLKVLYRNTNHIRSVGGRPSEVLRRVEPAAPPPAGTGGEMLRDAARAREMDEAEKIFARLAEGPAIDAFNDLQPAVHDDTEVHRVVLAYRAWSLLDLVGMENAHTMLRESVRFCVNAESQRLARGRPEPPIRKILPRLLDQHRLLQSTAPARQADDAWMSRMTRTIYDSTPEQAADAVAGALAEGFTIEAVGEAISLAANELQLRDRNARVHGACLGVHASDSANAWRNIARVTSRRNAVASMIAGAYHISEGGQHNQPPYPLASHREAVVVKDPAALLRETEVAIRANDQGHACAAVQRYGELGHPARPLFDLLSRFAVSEGGRLHGEKYYVTVREAFATTRPALRWRHLLGLARATASAYGYTMNDKPGYRAAGYEEACQLLQVEV